MKQKVFTPAIKNCYCGSRAESVFMDQGSRVHCVENHHILTPIMGSRHRAICRWNNTLTKMENQE